MNSHCPHCGQVLHIPDSLAGKTVGCPKCQASFRVPAAEANDLDAPPINKPAAPWAAPIPRGTPVPSFEPAGPARSTPLSPAPAAPPEPAPPPELEKPAPPPPIAPVAPTPKASAAPRSRWREPTSWIDFFDWRFETYLTPWIIRFTWIAILALSFLSLVMAVVGTLLPAGSSSSFGDPPEFRGEPPFRMPEFVQNLVRIFLNPVVQFSLQVMGIVFTLLWCRVVLEFVIVIFNIAETGRSIEAKLEESGRRGG